MEENLCYFGVGRRLAVFFVLEESVATCVLYSTFGKVNIKSFQFCAEMAGTASMTSCYVVCGPWHIMNTGPLYFCNYKFNMHSLQSLGE